MKRVLLGTLAAVTLIALLLPSNGPLWAAKAWGAEERGGIRNSLRLFDRNDLSCGTGRYVLQTSDGGLLFAELELSIDGEERIHQKVEMTNNGALQPLSYRHEHIGASGVKAFEIDFRTGRVRCSSPENGRRDEQATVVEFDRDRTFAGLMFILLAIHFPQGLTEIEGYTINFDSKLEVLKVRLRRISQEQISLADGTFAAIKYAIEPILPQLFSFLVGSSFDSHVWVSATEPGTFLRFEGSLEPGGRFLRVE